MKRLLIISLAVLLSSAGISQDNDQVDDRWTLGFNLHKLGGFRWQSYVRHENIRVGYFIHEYHQAGIEFGTLRPIGGSMISPMVGPYYRFQALDGKFHPFFEGSAKILFTRTTALEKSRSAMFSGLVGLNIELSDRFSVDAAVGRMHGGFGSTFKDWDQYMGFSYRFGG